IGCGGSWSGGVGVGCGRSIGILCDSIGTVIMKMISSTSITSTSGVTLMSAIGPLPPPVVNAISNRSCTLLSSGALAVRLGDEPEFCDAGALGVAHYCLDQLIFGVL